MLSRQGRELFLRYSSDKTGVSLDPQVVLDEIGRLASEPRSSCEDALLCYNVVKLMGPCSSAVACSLALYRACCGLETRVQLYGSAVIGSLLVTGIGLSKCIDTVAVTEHTGEFLMTVEDALERLSAVGVWDQYGMTLFKSMNKLAVGLLTRGEQDVCLDVCRRGILGIAVVCPGVLPQALKAVVGISQHVSGDPKRLDLLLQAMEVGMHCIQTHHDGEENNDYVSECMSMLEQSMSCARRVLVSIVEKGNCDILSDKMEVLRCMSSCLEFISGRGGGSIHAAVAALAAIGRSLSAKEWNDYNTNCGRYIRSVEVVLGIDAGYRCSSRLDRWSDSEDAVRELRWFSSVLHRCAKDNEDVIDMACDMMCGSVGCCIVAAKHNDDMNIPHEFVQRVRYLVNLALENPSHLDAMFGALAASICLAWNMSMPEYVTRVIAAAIHQASAATRQKEDHMDFSRLIELVDTCARKHKVQRNIVEHVVRDCLVSLSECGMSQSQAGQVVTAAKQIFDPGKSPDEYVRVMLACYECVPSVFSEEEVFSDLRQALEKTKTKIGRRRIEDIMEVMRILQFEQGVGVLLRESAAYQGQAVAMRRKRLLENPALVHAEDSGSMERDYIKYMLSKQESWKSTIRTARELVRMSANIKTLSAHACMVEDMETLVHLHDPLDPDVSSFWRLLFQTWMCEDTSVEQNIIEIQNGSVDSQVLPDLHMACSRYHAMHGESGAAIFHAIEAHRYISPKVVFREGENTTMATTGLWWSLVSQHLCCVSWLGFLFATSGMYDEAIQSYKEGLRYACLVGASLGSAYFCMCLAHVYYDGGNFSKFTELVREGTKILDTCGRTESPMFLCLNAQHDALMGLNCRKSLLFEDSAQKIEAASKCLDAFDNCGWYAQQIKAFCALEKLNIMVDEKSSDVVRKHLDASKDLMESLTVHSFLLGTPFYKLILLQAQAHSQSFFKRHEMLGPRLWVEEVSGQDMSAFSGLNVLWKLYDQASPSPFCQRIIGLLLAPICASRGYRYTSVALLHLSSNATLKFQQELVSLTKHFQKILKDPKAVYGFPREYSRKESFIHGDVEGSKMAEIEVQAQQVVSNWLEQLPSLIVCGVSVYSSAIYGRLDTFKDKIVLHRMRKGQVPIMLEIPSPEVEFKHPIHMLHGTKSCGSLQLLRDKFQDILRRSNSNMKSISPKSVASYDQRAWWEERVDLDNSMQSLLEELQSDWIGPWKCLFRDLDASFNSTSHIENDEIGLLTALLSVERYSLSQSDLEIICSILNRAIESKSIDGYNDEFPSFSGDTLNELFKKLNIGEARGDNSVCRKVSFQDEAPKSPECVTVLRSEQIDEVSDKLSGIQIVEKKSNSEENRPVTDTPGDMRGLTAQCHGATTVKKKKHKSRLAQMHSLATPAPRRAFGSHNISTGVCNTPRTTAKQARSVTPLMDTIKTVPRARTSKPKSPNSHSSIPVALILDHAVQCLPWESSFACVQDSAWEFYRLPSLPAFCETKARKDAIHLDSVYYAINPEGDLASTQQTFEKWFRELKGWTGKAGSPPNAQELSRALQEKDLFVYCGHGAGEQYIPIPRLRSLASCASCLLMGCSSGRLKWNNDGLYEATGVILAYMIAGCPAVVGTLWDVTDKDIDRYCQEVVTKCISAASLNDEMPDRSLGHMAQTARHACKLPYLIGAAPVCYGIPIHFC